MTVARAPRGCNACAEIGGTITAPGGVIFDDGLWRVSHHTGAYTDPGELIVKTRRHCESLEELSPAEAAALGPILRAAVGAIQRVIKPERVYAVSFNERVRHVHFLLLPRTTGMPRGHVISDLYRRARSLLRKAGMTQNPSPGERAEAAEGIRRVWDHL
jgi:diadenosine tetraphosphate (Ap4A) HIT family hydrolase